jgi:hypothetical protein
MIQMKTAMSDAEMMLLMKALQANAQARLAARLTGPLRGVARLRSCS